MKRLLSSCFWLSLSLFLPAQSLDQDRHSERVIVHYQNQDFSSLKIADSLNWPRASEIAWIEPDHLYEASLIPNDINFDLQWGAHNIGQGGGLAGADIGLAEAWDLQTGSESIVVGVIDSGVDWQHPDLIDNIWQNLAEDADGDGHVLEFINGQWQFDPGDINGIDEDNNGYVDDFIGWDFVNDDNDPSDDHIFSHGTHVAGIIAARGNNGIGVSGVSWQSQIMPLKFLNHDGTGFASDAVAALDYAREMGAQISNNSWGSAANNQTLLQSIQQAQLAGHIFVAAAGNNYGNNNDRAPIFPAAYELDNIITVTATDEFDRLANFANIGAESVDIAAPGYAIYSTVTGGQYGYLSGTSMAAPQVSGAICLLLSENMGLNYQAVINRLLRSATILPALQGKCRSSGRLKISEALQRPVLFQKWYDLIGAVSSMDAIVRQGRIYLTQTQNADVNQLEFDLNGQLVNSQKFSTGLTDTRAQILPKHLVFEEANGNGLPNVQIQAYDENQNINWEASIGASQSDFLTEVVSDERHLWLAMQSDNFVNPALLVSKLDSNGWLNWQRPIPFANDLTLEAMNVGPNRQLQLASVESSGSSQILHFWQLDSTGQALPSMSYTFDNSNNLQVRNLSSLKDADGELVYWLGGTVLRNAQPHLWLLWLEEDGEVQLGMEYAIPNLKTPLQMMVHEGLAYIFHSYQGQAEAAFYQIGLRGDILSAHNYSLAADSIVPHKILALPGGGIFLSGVEYKGTQARLWVEQLRHRGLSACGQNSSSISTGLPFFPTENASIVPPSQEVDVFAATSPLTWQNLSLQDSAYCDNSQCTVEAFFYADKLVACETATIQLTNLSSAAISYEWRANGQLFSTQQNPIFSPMQEGSYEISLSAIDGDCVDESSLFITIEEELNPIVNDTSHCGSSLVLDAGLDALSYAWRDSNGVLLGVERKQRFMSSGEFELEVTDACGESESTSFNISLQSGCMWPGDVNTDGEVNTLDFLLLGLANSQSGTPRSNPSSVYAPQNASDWGSGFAANNPWAANIDYKHADCDGDGTVNLAQDAAIILQNVTPANRLTRDSSASAISLSIQPNQSVVNVGDSISFDLVLEDPSGGIIQDAYGITFSLYYNLPISFAPDLRVDSSWMAQGVPQSLSTIQIPYPAQNRFDIAITRGDQLNVSGEGFLGRSCCASVVIDDIGDYAASSEQVFLSLSLDNALLIKNDGSRIPISSIQAQGAQSIQVIIPQSSTSLESEMRSSFQLYPNPNEGKFKLRFTDPPTGFFELRLYNTQGQLVWQEQAFGEAVTEIKLPSSLAKGLYWISLRKNNKRLGQKAVMLE